MLPAIVHRLGQVIAVKGATPRVSSTAVFGNVEKDEAVVAARLDEGRVILTVAFHAYVLRQIFPGLFDHVFAAELGVLKNVEPTT